jgi:hypothetical protein
MLPAQPIREIPQVSLSGGPQSDVMALKIVQFAVILAPPTRNFCELVIDTLTVLDRVVETPQLVHGSDTERNSLTSILQFEKFFYPRINAPARTSA